MKEIELGSVVLSKAGRDKGRFYIVVELVDQNYVKIADGDLRKLEKPKLKKIKHLKCQDIVLEKIQKKLVENIKIFDAEIRSALRAYNG